MMIENFYVLIVRAKMCCICLGICCGLNLLLSGPDRQGVPMFSFCNKVQACIVQVITGTVNTTFSENQAKYLDVPESNEPQYDHSEDKANITPRFSLPKLAEPRSTTQPLQKNGDHGPSPLNSLLVWLQTP
jgi:hypothetical protein